MRRLFSRIGGVTLSLLLLAAGALAAPTQNLMDFLADEGVDTSDPAALSHLHTVGETKTALDVRLTLEGLYYDGEMFLLGWRTENLMLDAPSLVLYTEVTADGEALRADADHPVSSWWPAMFGLFVAGDPINNLMDRFIIWDMEGQDLRGRGETVIEARFTVKRPMKPIAIVDPEIHVPYDDSPEMEADRQAMLQALSEHGVAIAEAGDTDAAGWAEKGYLVLDRYGKYLLSDPSKGVPALDGLDLPDTETEDVILSFSVDLDALASGG